MTLMDKMVTQKPKVMPLCACGCGERITWIIRHRYNGIPKYKIGHIFKNRKLPKETLEKYYKGRQNYLISEKTKKKISQTLMGHKHSKEAKKLMSLSKQNEKHPLWKGEQASYTAKHIWIRRHYGKAQMCQNLDCECKNPKRFDWANLSGKYLREIKDYIQLCVSCHKKADLNNNIKKLRIKWSNLIFE